ncbi:tyrosine-protein phosphatase [Brevundimonas variabilis]|uniref:Protein tyrosine/serine phosphatase n=1 Tax=Brevundimonas variabilis TaxID=74312 RepID=A0A7W9CH31_9CAUL|nr:tyrosine-protein phosphatase [Brevundimonas variabilis]MBB5745520.1 protein tyrosine/serine phosphatase [Brevundimonas variabilis]
MTTVRLHPFDAIDNFRDFGGYPTLDGRQVRSGRLYRSAHHARMTEADLGRLAGYGIGAVVDLRRPVERQRQPSLRPEGFSGLVIENDLDAQGEAPHITFLKTSDLTPDSGRRFMMDTYGRMPFAPTYHDLFRRYFEILATSDGAIVVHCAAGKDRTGLLVALTHHLLGVGQEDMMADYLLTNAAVDLEQMAPSFAKQIEAMSGRKPSEDAVVAFMGVEPAYLEAAFAAINLRYGSIDVYLDQVIGVDEFLRSRIIERLTT